MATLEQLERDRAILVNGQSADALAVRQYLLRVVEREIAELKSKDFANGGVGYIVDSKRTVALTGRYEVDPGTHLGRADDGKLYPVNSPSDPAYFGTLTERIGFFRFNDAPVMSKLLRFERK